MKNSIKKSFSALMLLVIATILIFTATPVEAASTKAPAKVKSFKSTRQTVSSVKFTWKKVANVKGYQLYRKAPNSKWKKVATIKGKKKTYTNLGLKSETKYKYKIRAFRTYKSKGKTKYKYGKFSKAITAKTKEVLATYNLKDGYYTAGIDIPAGSFDVTAKAGVGYILSESDAVNLRGPEYKKGDFYNFEDYYRSYAYYRLPKKDILEVTGVQVTIKYNSISAEANPRTYDKDAGIILKPGYYVVGKDISAGRYCIEYVSGEGGYVSSDRTEGECIVSHNMDGDPKTGEYVDYVSNVILVNGETIEVTDGLKVMFIPEKIE